MKTFIAIVALAAAIASPALARTSKGLNEQESAATAAQAFQPRNVRTAQLPASANNQRVHNVYVDGQYLGADPDPLVREQMRHDDLH
jgi:uncharacterized protein YdeI (BOF family)